MLETGESHNLLLVFCNALWLVKKKVMGCFVQGGIVFLEVLWSRQMESIPSCSWYVSFEPRSFFGSYFDEDTLKLLGVECQKWRNTVTFRGECAARNVRMFLRSLSSLSSLVLEIRILRHCCISSIFCKTILPQCIDDRH